MLPTQIGFDLDFSSKNSSPLPCFISGMPRSCPMGEGSIYHTAEFTRKDASPCQTGRISVQVHDSASQHSRIFRIQAGLYRFDFRSGMRKPDCSPTVLSSTLFQLMLPGRHRFGPKSVCRPAIRSGSRGDNRTACRSVQLRALPGSSSDHGHAAVYVQRLARNVVGISRRQETDRRGNFVSAAHPPDRDSRQESLPLLLLEP